MRDVLTSFDSANPQVAPWSRAPPNLHVGAVDYLFFMTEIPELRSIEYAAEKLGVTRDTYIRNLRNRVWPGVKVARRWSVTDADVVAAIDSSRTAVEVHLVDPLTPTTRRNLEKRRC